MVVKYNKIIALDLEATCDKPKPVFSPEIIEIGLCTINLKSLEIENKEFTFVTPSKSWVTPYCTELTTITPEDVLKKNGARTFPEAINWLKKFGKNKAWISWGDYDRIMLEKSCQEYNVEYPLSSTHINAKAIFSFFVGLNKGINLRSAVDYLGLTWEGTHHRGVDDAVNLGRIFLELIKRKQIIRHC